jgi:hypothetical protein
MPLNITTTRDHLQKFEFTRLFIDELGWSNPKSRTPVKAQIKETAYTRTPIAQLSGVVVFEVTTGMCIPDAKTRAAIQKHVAEEHVENLLIFLDAASSQSLWYWVKRESGKAHARDHLYVKGQPGDLFLSKLAAMVVDISELDAEGNIPVTEVANRLKAALDVERVTKKFYGEFDTQRLAFVQYIEDISDDRQRRWYASVLMNRLMFIWFLQRKGFLDGADRDYLTNKLAASKKRGADKFYSAFLKSLFFEGFAKPESARSQDTRVLLGKIRYLNGGLFLPHRVELNHGFPDKLRIKIPDVAFDNIFALFKRYSWNLNDTPGGDDQEINPDVLGYIFEKYINQKEFGAYYTRPEMTGYLCERTIYKLVLDRVNQAFNRRFASISDLLLNLDANLCRVLLFEVLPALRLLDPACGSGAFLVAAMKVLIAIYSAVIGKIQFLNDVELAMWQKRTQAEHPSVLYFIKKQIITNNLFGVDIMEEATEIARLRLFLALVASAQTEDQLEPLPNIDFNILAGNSLVGLLRVDPARFDAGQNKNGGTQDRLTLQHSSDLGFTVETKTAPTTKEKQSAFVAQQNAARFSAILDDKNKSIELYRKHAFQPGEKDGLTQEERLIALRSHIENVREQSYVRLNQMLLDEFKALGIEFHEATWDDENNDDGKPIKQALKTKDIEALQPFHWGYEFDKVIVEGGFDGIVTNPPWEVFQTNEKEFFQNYAPAIQRKKLRIEDWQKQRDRLMRDPEIRADWLAYASRFPHQWGYFKKSRQYANQISIVDGKAVGNKPNLYNLFTEQCFNLLRPGGQCGIVIPSGIYTDLGAKQLREMLFTQANVEGLFCFENRKEIFENVHRSFKFVVLTFAKGGGTEQFPAAFMRHEVTELARFPTEGAVNISVNLVRRLSPDSLSVMEFKSDQDVQIAQKMAVHPMLLGDPKGWNLELYGEELNMTRSAEQFVIRQTKSTLFEGGMIWQFDHRYSEPRYWVKETDLRQTFLGKRCKRIEGLKHMPKDLRNDYEVDRIAIRKIASNTNERTLIVALIPPYSFAGNSLSVHFPFHHTKDSYNTLRFSGPETLAIIAELNSFVVDYVLRSRMTTNLNLFYLYQLPIPRLTAAGSAFGPIVLRAAQLICTTPEFDALAREVSAALRLPPAKVKGVTEAAARARLRAELDGLIAHLYGLTESEFAHILTTFPLVAQGVKDAALDAYRDA